MSTIKVRTRMVGDVVTVKTLMSHEMQPEGQKDKQGELIDAHYITEVRAEHAGRVVMRAHWSGGISKNPYLSFRFKGAAAGDKLTISWQDNQGNSDSLETELSA